MIQNEDNPVDDNIEFKNLQAHHKSMSPQKSPRRQRKLRGTTGNKNSR